MRKNRKSREDIQRRRGVRDYCYNELRTVENILESDSVKDMTPLDKLRLVTKKSILNRLINEESCFYFYDIEQLSKYINEEIDKVCGSENKN